MEPWFSKDYDKAAAPAGLPDARCIKPKETGSTSLNKPICWIAVGRYVGQVSGANEQDLHQRTAAQYKLLADAH